MGIFAWIILGIIGLAVVWLIGTYNSLVRSKSRTDESWSDIDVQLRRRYDLIPNLVEAVNGYSKYESDVFQKVTAARTAAMSATGMEEKAKAENMLSATLKSLFAVSESYPELKASQNFLQLQDELSDTENKIQAARRFYNSNVLNYTVKLNSFPSNLVAGPFGFTARQYFEIGEEVAKQPVGVKF